MAVVVTAVVALAVVALLVVGCSNEPEPERDPQSVHGPDVTLPAAECTELTDRMADAAARMNGRRLPWRELVADGPHAQRQAA